MVHYGPETKRFLIDGARSHVKRLRDEAALIEQWAGVVETMPDPTDEQFDQLRTYLIEVELARIDRVNRKA